MHYSEIIDKAYQFAIDAHNGQLRKYHGSPYIQHPCNVAQMVETYVKDNDIPYKTGIDMISAAYLHDVIEDCNIQKSELEKNFGPIITSYVVGMTNVSKVHSDLNRKERKALDRKRMSLECKEVKLIKLCDRIDNVRDFRTCFDKGLKDDFRILYAEESLSLLRTALEGTSVYHEIELENQINALSKKIPL